MPEESPSQTIARATLLGVLSTVPVVGGGVAGAIQGAAQAAARARDEDWWAMISARLTSLEREVQEQVRFDDPAFVAALHRLTRAAQETEDDDKRRRLAAALAYSGSWSSLPADHRHRMERILIEASSREVFLLQVFVDPEAWLAKRDPGALTKYKTMMVGSVGSFVDGHLAKGDRDERLAIRKVIDSISRRGLVDIPMDSTITGGGILQSRATTLGTDFVRYLETIEADSSSGALS